MMLQFTKNVHFTKLVKISDRLREFNFRRVPDAIEQLFHVDVSDDRGNRIMFQMNKDGNAWHIANGSLPLWIMEQESKLNELIEEELKNL